MKHITVKGVLIFSGEDFEEVMQWMAEGECSSVARTLCYHRDLTSVTGKLQGYEKMVTSRISVEDIVEKGFKELINNKDKHIKIMVTPNKSLLTS